MDLPSSCPEAYSFSNLILHHSVAGLWAKPLQGGAAWLTGMTWQLFFFFFFSLNPKNSSADKDKQVTSLWRQQKHLSYSLSNSLSLLVFLKRSAGAAEGYGWYNNKTQNDCNIFFFQLSLSNVKNQWWEVKFPKVKSIQCTEMRPTVSHINPHRFWLLHDKSEAISEDVHEELQSMWSFTALH